MIVLYMAREVNPALMSDDQSSSAIHPVLFQNSIQELAHDSLVTYDDMELVT